MALVTVNRAMAHLLTRHLVGVGSWVLMGLAVGPMQHQVLRFHCDMSCRLELYIVVYTCVYVCSTYMINRSGYVPYRQAIAGSFLRLSPRGVKVNIALLSDIRRILLELKSFHKSTYLKKNKANSGLSSRRSPTLRYQVHTWVLSKDSYVRTHHSIHV